MDMDYTGLEFIGSSMFNLFGKTKKASTTVKVVVEYECEYTGHITEDNIDYSDVLTIANIKTIKKLAIKKH